jgi:hypothetical protein
MSNLTNYLLLPSPKVRSIAAANNFSRGSDRLSPSSSNIAKSTAKPAYYLLMK